MTAIYQNFHTAQNGPHEQLINTIERYSQTRYLRPIAAHQRSAFERIKSFAKSCDAPLILDSGCGTGLSSMTLAKKFPHFGIIGIDKSIERLKRQTPSNLSNCLLIRGDVIDLWRLFALEGLPIERHYLLFPNPWPKISHVKRRFYAHPVFKTMITLAPYFELRTNWRIYADECVMALKFYQQRPTIKLKTDNEMMSLFEKKYMEAACPIYIVTNDLTERVSDECSSFSCST